jgi:kynureninase
LCGNSLGLQPKRTRQYLDLYLTTWASQGVYGHFKPFDDALTNPWMNLDDQASAAMAPIVGALPSEVAVMQTLTANLHFLLASFYRPNRFRSKILIEAKAFPSDHFVAQSHIRHHGLYEEDLVLLEPDNADAHTFSTAHILATIDEHADELALILLPGIQFYTGQLLDIAAITDFAHSKGLVIGWDLAHAAGNVPLHLHQWNVDFAAWCTYKYLNSGPGCIGAIFVHDRHSRNTNPDGEGLRPMRRLSGWWGSDKATRFDMDNRFVPIAGAAGWQLSNPSALDITSLLASLSVFAMTDMSALRRRSERLTAYLAFLLANWPCGGSRRPYVILTPAQPSERGAQISVRLDKGLLDGVMEDLEEAGVVVDERKPDVIRVAPTPLYNSFGDVWQFMSIFWKSLEKRRKHPN